MTSPFEPPPCPPLEDVDDEFDLKLEESDGLNSGVSEGQPSQLLEASQRSEEPVSRITGNDLPGVPTVTVPM